MEQDMGVAADAAGLSPSAEPVPVSSADAASIPNARLTKKECETLNDAMAIIRKYTVARASWQIYASNYKGSQFTYDVTYFDSAGRQHSLLSNSDDRSFAGLIKKALSYEATALRDAQAIRADRIKSLRKQLDELEATGA